MSSVTSRNLLVFFLVWFLVGLAYADKKINRTPDDAAVLARQQLILGHPPRIAPLDPSALDAASKQAVVDIWKALGQPPNNEMPEYFLTMLKHPQLMLRQIEMSIQLFKGDISPRDRELAILRLAWLCQAPYEWGEHVPTGKRLGGITSEEVARVKVGSSAQGWTAKERALLRAVEELHGDAMIAEATWQQLSEHFNEKQLLELPILVGFYQSIAYLQNSVRFRLMPGGDGLLAK